MSVRKYRDTVKLVATYPQILTLKAPDELILPRYLRQVINLWITELKFFKFI